MSRNKLIGITVACIVVVIVVVIATAGGPTPPAGADSPVSDFLEVGDFYYAISSSGSYYWFQVLEIVNDKWILVDAPETYGTIWLNTGQLLHIGKED